MFLKQNGNAACKNKLAIPVKKIYIFNSVALHTSSIGVSWRRFNVSLLQELQHSCSGGKGLYPDICS